MYGLLRYTERGVELVDQSEDFAALRARKERLDARRRTECPFHAVQPLSYFESGAARREWAGAIVEDWPQ